MGCKRREIWGYNPKQEECRACIEQLECERDTIKILHGVAADFNHLLGSKVGKDIWIAKRLRAEINNAWEQWYYDSELKPVDALRTFNDFQISTRRYISTFLEFGIKDPAHVGYQEGLLSWLLFTFRNDRHVLDAVDETDDPIDTISALERSKTEKIRKAYNSYLRKVQEGVQDKINKRKRPGTKRDFPPLWFSKDEVIKRRLGNPNDKAFQNLIIIFQHLWDSEQHINYQDSYALMIKLRITGNNDKDHTPIFLKPLDYERIARLIGLQEGKVSLRYYIQEMIRAGILKSTGKKFERNGQRILSIGFYIPYGPYDARKYTKIKFLSDTPQMRTALREFQPLKRRWNGQRGLHL